MERKPPKTKATKGDEGKAARLKAALKANMARRKAQARARGTTGASDGAGGKD
jgi:hypothetical protein